MEITTNFPGGNIDVIATEGNIIKVKPQLRDTAGDWFYWAFCVSGAAGRTLTFDFLPYKYIGYHGPAVSHNLKEWRWAGDCKDLHSFTYTFGEGEDCVYFAHDMLYGVERFYSFAEGLGLQADQLCISEKGRSVPVLRFGQGDGKILLTARHHCCESTGNYVLEGIVKALCETPLPGHSVIVVPFVDIDGVVEGDQGKNRIPHDHNRDYKESPIYASVRAIKDIILGERIRYAFDLHSPWHVGGRNDKVFIVRYSEKSMPRYIRFGKLLEEEAGGEAMKYDPMYDIDPGVEWNTQQQGMGGSFSSFCDAQPGTKLSFTLETAYFGGHDDVVSQEKLIATGRAFSRALLKYDS